MKIQKCHFQRENSKNLQFENVARFARNVFFKCIICKVLESDQWNWLPINHWSLLRTLQIPLFQIPTTSEDQNGRQKFFKKYPNFTNSIVWDLKKIREMKSDTIFVLKSMKKTRQIAMLRGTNGYW